MTLRARWLCTLSLLSGCPSSTPPGDDAKGPERTPAPETVRIPAGSFTMGSPVDEIGRYPDEVPHQVIIEREYLMSATVITREQFIGLMGYESTPMPGQNVPITSVTWHEAAAYTVALSEERGLTPCYGCQGQGPGVQCLPTVAPTACDGWRLPTEAEWEHGARGGLEGQAFPNGGGLQAKDILNCWGPVQLTNGIELGEMAWHCGRGGGIKPVALLTPNDWGLYDMAGNIWEWCHDWHAPYTGDASDPTGPAQGEERVARGGSSKLYYPVHMRVAFRLAVDPDTRAPQMGFRVVRNAR